MEEWWVYVLQFEVVTVGERETVVVRNKNHTDLLGRSWDEEYENNFDFSIRGGGGCRYGGERGATVLEFEGKSRKEKGKERIQNEVHLCFGGNDGKIHLIELVNGCLTFGIKD